MTLSLSFLSWLTIISRVFVSTSPVGSSARMMAGWFESALAMAVRCCSPPDNSDGLCFILSASPICVRITAIFFLSFLGFLANASQYPHFQKLSAWYEVKMLEHKADLFTPQLWHLAFFCFVISLSSMNTLPDVGLSRSPIMERSVDLPLPEGLLCLRIRLFHVKTHIVEA